tara:strand:+ start:608 stop:880 length:273 start_codon:yes stop_codon:yes gene_type:complete
MSVGGKKDSYDFYRQEDDLDWHVDQRLNIREIRMIYSSISHYQRNWEKYNGGRPPEEMDFLNWYKTSLFTMITDYNYYHHEVDTPSENDT